MTQELKAMVKLLNKFHTMALEFNTFTTKNSAERVDAIADDLERYIKEIENQG